MITALEENIAGLMPESCQDEALENYPRKGEIITRIKQLTVTTSEPSAVFYKDLVSLLFCHTFHVTIS